MRMRKSDRRNRSVSGKRVSGIRAWPLEDRPREKLFRKGEHKLSKTELIAILLGTGTKGSSALDVAREIMKKFRTLRGLSSVDIAHWKGFRGLGAAKIARIKAAIEIGRRFREDEVKEEKIRMKSSKDVAHMLMPRMRDLKREVFQVVFLDSQNKVVEVEEVEEGTVNQANPIIREIFQKALQAYAPAIICAHNHPSGNPQPSRDDERFTRKLLEAGNVLQVKVLDHIIIGNDDYYSFSDKGKF